MSEACLYKGSVFHKRYAPKVHTLKYKVFTLFADLDKIEDLAKSCRLFSYNKFNVISFYERDFGNPEASDNKTLKERMLDLLEQNSVDSSDIEKIMILAYPRVFGYVFNPLTVYYCYGHNEQHVAIIYEVRNTFSERHNYIYSVPDGGCFEDAHRAQKKFHVSPFFDSAGEYQFRLKNPEKNISVLIDYKHEGNPRLRACFNGHRRKFNDRELFDCATNIPFMTLKVFVGILYEAAKLKFKGLRVFSHTKKHVYQSSLVESGTVQNPLHVHKEK